MEEEIERKWCMHTSKIFFTGSVEYLQAFPSAISFVIYIKAEENSREVKRL